MAFRLTGGQLAFVTGTAILVSFAAGSYTTKRRIRREQDRIPNPSPYPYVWNERAVRRQVLNLIRAGERDRAFVAAETASRLFGEHPDGGPVTFPPGPDSPDGVLCVWTLVVHVVDSIFKDELLEEQEDSSFWVLHNPNDAEYPWEEPSLHPDNYPSPGMFFDAGSPTRLESASDADHDLEKTVRRALGIALVMANMDPSLATGTSNTSKRLRREFRQLISSSKFNDLAYGQTDLAKAGEGAYVLNEHGRGLNWLPNHADNMQLLGSGQNPKRGSSVSGEPLEGSSSDMFLWIPAIDLASLSNTTPSVLPFQWSDGSSTVEPPPSIQRMDIDMNGVVL